MFVEADEDARIRVFADFGKCLKFAQADQREMLGVSFSSLCLFAESLHLGLGTKNVLNRPAAHQETDLAAKDPLIVKLSCSLMGAKAKMIAVPGTAFAKLLGENESLEEFNCNYGLAPDLEPIFAGSDLKFVAYDEAHQVRAFQLSNHPFFIGTLFQPERRALRGTLHPLVNAFFQHVSSPVIP